MQSHAIFTPTRMTQLGMVTVVSLLCLCAAGNALAYKVERVCEMTEPTNKKPATKVCKTRLVKGSPAPSKDGQKEASKEEKPAAAARK